MTNPGSPVPPFSCSASLHERFTAQAVSSYSWIMLADRTMRRLHEPWREKVAIAQRQYESDRTEENKREYLRVLKLFANLVVRSEIPAQP